MTMTEFWLAWLSNFRGLFFVLAVCMATGVLICGMLWQNITESWNEEDKERGAPYFKRKQIWREESLPKVKAWFRRFLWALPVTVLLCSVPSLDDVWRLRVNLLKLEVASPENVAKLGGHVEEVVTALECKHLGVNCPKPVKESK